jgi:hypothetical protein
MDTPPELPVTTAPRPGLALLIGATILVLLNMWLGFAREMRNSGNVSAAIGGAMSQLIFPVLVALLFSISKRFRNPRSRTKVVLWTSVLVFLTTLGSLGHR